MWTWTISYVVRMPYRIVVASWGGAGHLGPTLTAAGQLRRHGHSVRFISRPDARFEVEKAGFGFAAWHELLAFPPSQQSRLVCDTPTTIFSLGRQQPAPRIFETSWNAYRRMFC